MPIAAQISKVITPSIHCFRVSLTLILLDFLEERMVSVSTSCAWMSLTRSQIDVIIAKIEWEGMASYTFQNFLKIKKSRRNEGVKIAMKQKL
mmetsp:Transcript_26206/g.46792  ORF Transcript_26206/g.46792 Transcript_26206/m.46792 type:complete len:92 (+) Transcript_26206:750-1025(+)